MVWDRKLGETGVNHVPLAVQCIYGWKDEGGENRDGKEGSEVLRGWERKWRLPGLFVLCGES